MKKSFEKLGIALLSVALIATAQAARNMGQEDDKDTYVPWPFASVKDAGSGAVGIVTANHAGNAKDTAYIVPDAIPGVPEARHGKFDKKSDKQSSPKNMKQKDNMRKKKKNRDEDYQ